MKRYISFSYGIGLLFSLFSCFQIASATQNEVLPPLYFSYPLGKDQSQNIGGIPHPCMRTFLEKAFQSKQKLYCSGSLVVHMEKKYSLFLFDVESSVVHVMTFRENNLLSVSCTEKYALFIQKRRWGKCFSSPKSEEYYIQPFAAMHFPYLLPEAKHFFCACPDELVYIQDRPEGGMTLVIREKNNKYCFQGSYHQFHIDVKLHEPHPLYIQLISPEVKQIGQKKRKENVCSRVNECGKAKKREKTWSPEKKNRTFPCSNNGKEEEKTQAVEENHVKPKVRRRKRHKSSKKQKKELFKKEMPFARKKISPISSDAALRGEKREVKESKVLHKPQKEKKTNDVPPAKHKFALFKKERRQEKRTSVKRNVPKAVSFVSKRKEKSKSQSKRNPTHAKKQLRSGQSKKQSSPKKKHVSSRNKKKKNRREKESFWVTLGQPSKVPQTFGDLKKDHQFLASLKEFKKLEEEKTQAGYRLMLDIEEGQKEIWKMKQSYLCKLNGFVEYYMGLPFFYRTGIFAVDGTNVIVLTDTALLYGYILQVKNKESIYKLKIKNIKKIEKQLIDFYLHKKAYGLADLMFRIVITRVLEEFPVHNKYNFYTRYFSAQDDTMLLHDSL